MSGPAQDEAAISAMAELLREWNTRINLVSRKETDFILDRHVRPLHRAGAVVPCRPGGTVVDVGTGGGLPGLVLALRYPGTRFTLVDSVGKKLKAVDDMVARLGLANVRTHHGRAEDLRERFDLVTGRAVADFGRFLAWTSHLLRNGPADGRGIWYFKGGDVAAELAGLGLAGSRVWSLADLASDPSLEDKVLVHLPTSSVREVARASGSASDRGGK